MKIRSLLLTLVVALSFGLAACDFGTVDQGRTVAFDKAAWTVTIVQDVKHDQLNPDYSGGLVTFKLPSVPEEMGPEPVAGGRLKLDVDKKEIVIFNPETKKVETLPIEVLDVQKSLGRDHPLIKGKAFPVIDKEKGTITEYSARQKLLATFKVPVGMENLPPVTWEAGNEVRIYFKQPGQALRFMNISKTNIYKR